MSSGSSTLRSVSSITAYTNEVVRDCYLDYGKYVVEERAIPDVRDGLKPGQRRILWSLYSLGVRSNKDFMKSGRVVGDVMGKYHPHGDASIYGALVHMTHQNNPLVEGAGNFGDFSSLREKSPAHSRYTECRMTPIADHFFDDILAMDKQPTYDDKLEEPVVVPVPVPWILINGSDGIAVGISTHIPPHNLKEVLEACCHLIDNPDADIEELLQFIKGPDYGVGILTAKKQDLIDLYETGEGKLSFGSQYHVEEGIRKNTKKLVITGLAPEVRKKRVIDTAITLHKSKLIDSPITDETTLKNGYRDTVTYRDSQVVRDRLLPLLESSVSYRWNCLDADGQPHRYTLLDILNEFIAFRRSIETKLFKDRLSVLKKQHGILVARHRAALNVKKVVRILQEAKDEKTALNTLTEILSVEKWQAEAILETPLKSIIRTQVADVKSKISKVKKEAKDIKSKLADLDDVLKERFKALMKYSKPRGTRLRGKEKDFGEDVGYWVGITSDGVVEASLDLPLKTKARWNYIDFVRTNGDFVVVHDTNQAVVANISYLDKYEPIGKVVGMVADKYCGVLTKKGKYVAFPTQQKRNQFTVIKDLDTDDSIVAVFGFDSDDLLVVDEDSPLKWFDAEDFKITRPNVKARSMKVKPLTVYTIKPEYLLVDDYGTELGTAEFSQAGVHVVGPSNIVSLHTGKRMVVSAKEAIELITNEEVATIVPINNEEDM